MLTLGLGSGMHPRNLVFITLLALCHPQLRGQGLTNGLPPAINATGSPAVPLPEDPGQEILPIAQPEAVPAT